jgi:hypothetical protein
MHLIAFPELQQPIQAFVSPFSFKGRAAIVINLDAVSDEREISWPSPKTSPLCEVFQVNSSRQN